MFVPLQALLRQWLAYKRAMARVLACSLLLLATSLAFTPAASASPVPGGHVPATSVVYFGTGASQTATGGNITCTQPHTFGAVFSFTARSIAPLSSGASWAIATVPVLGLSLGAILPSLFAPGGNVASVVPGHTAAARPQGVTMPLPNGGGKCAG
jgi:hypothetical protein